MTPCRRGIHRLLALLAWQDLSSANARPGLRRGNRRRLLVVPSRDVECPYCRKAHRLDARELRMVDVVGPGSQVLHTEIDITGAGTK